MTLLKHFLKAYFSDIIRCMKMKNETLKLLYTKKEWIFFVGFLCTIFLFNILLLHNKYQEFKKEELYLTTAEVQNIYIKKDYTVLKLRNEEMTFFTSVWNKKEFDVLDKIKLTLITTNIDFIDYLKGFYGQSFNVYKTKLNNNSIKKSLYINIHRQHEDKNIASLFHALFFALPLTQTMRDISSIFGISHLIAISGFHLGVMSFILYWILYYPYSFFHTKFYPYRNKRFDILVLTSIILLFYLLFTNVVPSLLRAFIMFVLGFYFLRCNIKLFSFETLMIVLLLILVFFPAFIFSLSLWFSIIAVFYIFLFLQYFKTLPKVGQFLLFNIWIYLAMNPFSHFFFGTTSLWQLASPLMTIGFTLFYPVEALAHLLGWGSFLDASILKWLGVKTTVYEVFTPIWFFFIYLIISFLSIWHKKAFILLNILFVAFNLYAYSF